MPPEHPDFDAQRPPAEPGMPPELRGPDAAPEELRPIYDRLQADAHAWSATIASDAPLAGYIRSLPRRFPQNVEEAAHMNMLPEYPDSNSRSRPTSFGRSDSPGGGFLRGRALPAIAAVLVVALLAGAFYALGLGRGGGTTAAAPTATTAQPTPIPTLIPTVALPPSGQGWTKAGPAYFEGTVAEAPSQPATLYSCGQQPTSNGDPSAPSFLGVSHDGGKTWKTSPIPAFCERLKVSPTNPLDVAYSGGNCGTSSGCAGGPDGLLHSWIYLSTDGGQHWTIAALPPNAAEPFQGWGYPIVWAGTTLFVAPVFGRQQTLPPGTHILAASANGGPFSWVDQNGLRAHVQSNAVVDLLTAVGSTLYVNLNAASCVDQQCSGVSGVAKTSDGGATWASITSIYQGESLLVTAGSPGHDLVAHPRSASYHIGPLLHSTDGGVTWSALPAMPGGLRPGDTSTFETPDGTLITSTGPHPVPTFRLSPGAASWTLVAPAVHDAGSDDLAAVSWDAGGHPLLLWEAALGLGLFSHPA